MAAVDSLRNKWESITPRERRMVALLGASAVVVLVLYVSLAIRDGMVKLEKKNARSRKALAALTSLKALPVAAAGGTEIPAESVPLVSYLFTAAGKANVTLGSVPTKDPVTRGSFTVHGAGLELRDLTLQQAMDFLEAIENDSKVVVVTGLQLRRNFRDKAKVEMSVDVSAYSKSAPAGEGGEAAGSGSAGKPGGGS
jgi:hypothetical protein